MSHALREMVGKLELEPELEGKVFSKADSFLIKLNSKLPSRVRHSGQSREAGCIFLACRSFDVPINGRSLVALSGLTKPKFDLFLNQFIQVLELRPEVSLSKLSVQFASPSISSALESLFEILVKRFEDLPKSKAIDVNREEGALKIAAFFVGCKALGIRIDRKKVSQGVVVLAKQIKHYEELITKLCPAELKTLTQNKAHPQSLNLSGTSKSVDAVKSLKNGTEPSSSVRYLKSPFAGYSMIRTLPLEQSQQYLDYLEWKRNILDATC